MARTDYAIDDDEDLSWFIGSSLRTTFARLLGDREQDVRAARRNSVPTVGVLWGYGGRDELPATGAEIINAAPSELLD